MYTVSFTGQFKKDYKLCKKRGLNLNLLHSIFDVLEKEGKLTKEYKPHVLGGNYKGNWECHILPNWLLIWLQNDTTKEIVYVRTGSHSDLFD